ncbi:MAG TPA: hypothetical protein VE843_12485, partial [Ktedonobacteraceae bacterium]|nr:hypothetical protein [Ktedonobacteraceae bacterium]
EGLLINFVILLALGILLGVIGGVLGGQFGRRRTRIPAAQEYQEAMFEPPVVDSEEPSAAAEPGESLATSEVEEPHTAPETDLPLSETPSKETTSSTQQTE